MDITRHWPGTLALPEEAVVFCGLFAYFGIMIGLLACSGRLGFSRGERQLLVLGIGYGAAVTALILWVMWAS